MCWEQLEHRASLLLSRADYVKWLERPDVLAIKARDRRPQLVGADMVRSRERRSRNTCPMLRPADPDLGGGCDGACEWARLGG